MRTVKVDWSLHPQVEAVIGGAHVLHPAPDLSDEERRFIEFAREADRYLAGLPDNLTDDERGLMVIPRGHARDLAADAIDATSHLNADDLRHVPAIVKEVMADHGISLNLIERFGWDWLHDALAR